MWILPLLALLLVGGLWWRAWQMRGERITVHFTEAHMLRPGDTVRYRGLIVGEVIDIALNDQLDATTITVALHEQAGRIAREGALFWIVRPRISPEGVSGLDTIVGPRYIALRPPPADAPARREFIGLDDPPVVAEPDEGDLEIILEARTRGSLQPGGPVLFRGVRVGTVQSVNLASDSSAVEARVHIERAYTNLLRQRTRFWDSGGIEINIGITGILIDIETLPSVMIGSVSFATPPEPGEPVRMGHRFTISPAAESSWLAWDPALAVGSALLPPGAPIPHMERAQLSWRTKILRRSQRRSGWVLVLESGVIGPADVLKIDAEAREGTSQLSIAGKSVPVHAAAHRERHGVAFIETDALSRAPWPRDRIRAASEPEECLILTSSGGRSMPLAAVRLSAASEGFWQVDRSISFDDDWHGAAVLSREDGLLLGLLLVEKGVGKVGLIVPGAIE